VKRMLALVIVLAAGLTPARAAETHRVSMSAQDKFCVSAPVCQANEDVRIAKGDSVEWLFSDPVCLALHSTGCRHTSTRGGGATVVEKWDSGPMPGAPGSFGLPSPKASFVRTFTVSGTFAYICVIHAGMNARVIVA